ncbi:MAG: hypothetical protein ACYCSF_02145 [Acidimicrobiales bacterium]
MSPKRLARGRVDPVELVPVVGKELGSALRARASTVHVEPDLSDLARRIQAAEDNPRPRGRLALAAAVVLSAAVAGGTLGSLLGPTHPQHALFSSIAGDQGGRLPGGPGHSRPHGRANNQLSAPRRLSRATVIKRVTGAGTSLAAYGTWLAPVAVSSGTAATSCHRAELVTTTATEGGARGTATGVVAVQPLAANGLELVDSGALPTPAGRDLWWATVAVGTRVARVAAEEPGGTTDVMFPAQGIAVLGGVAPSSATSRYFSIVAEDAAGQSLHSIGFLAGSGQEAVGTSQSRKAADPLVPGCESVATPVMGATARGSKPAAPLLAAASVVSAFHQAYNFALPADLAENLAAVASSDTLPGFGQSTRTINQPSKSATASAQAVDVSQVVFLSADTAEVIYRAGSGRWRTGTAVLTGRGSWQVARTTFCGDVANGFPLPGVVRPSLERICSR